MKGVKNYMCIRAPSRSVLTQMLDRDQGIGQWFHEGEGVVQVKVDTDELLPAV